MAVKESGARVGVLGGGALGLAAALRLAQAGQRVTVVEREPQLGGLAAGFRVGPSALEKFYHHIFATDTTIIRYFKELGLGDRLVWSQPNTSALVDGRLVKLGSIGAVLRLPLLPPASRLRLLFGMALLKAIPDERVFAGQRAAPWMHRLMGDRAYAAVWEPMLRGKFGERADDIAMSWLWSRVHERSIRLGYPRGGFQQLYEALGERITALGGTVLTGTAATSIRSGHPGSPRGPERSQVSSGASAGSRAERGPDPVGWEPAWGGKTVLVDTGAGQTLEFDRLLVTLPTRLFTRLAPELPEPWVQRYPGPEHFGAHVVIVGLDRPLTPDVYWLNINDRDLPFLALVEHTNFPGLPISDYGGLHLVYLGNYLPMDHPLFGKSDEQTLAEFLPHLRRVNPGFDAAWVKAHWVFRAPYAQPIVTLDYLASLPPHQTPLPGVYLANMAHVYPQDRGQNYSLRLGERMARLMLRGEEGLGSTGPVGAAVGG